MVEPMTEKGQGNGFDFQAVMLADGRMGVALTHLKGCVILQCVVGLAVGIGDAEGTEGFVEVHPAVERGYPFALEAAPWGGLAVALTDSLGNEFLALYETGTEPTLVAVRCSGTGSPNLVSTADGLLHYLCIPWTPRHLVSHYIVREGGSVEAGHAHRSWPVLGWVKSGSMAIDGSGTIHLAFHPGRAGALWYARKPKDGEWETTLVEEGGVTYGATAGVSDKGDIDLLYRLEDGGIVLARMGRDGSWERRPVGRGRRLAQSPALAYGPSSAGNPDILFVADPPGPDSLGTIEIVWGSTGQQETVAHVNASSISAFLLEDADGNVIVAYVDWLTAPGRISLARPGAGGR